MQTIYHKNTKHQHQHQHQQHHEGVAMQIHDAHSYALWTNGVLSSKPTEHKHLVVGVRGM
ncbi:unnamed protein product [Schistosoma curassoni]|uniref:Uncharacterized protein n=1 Tax=Schistosoma curassoni TaxID=6186 RepID=A0A183KDZ3_9TREM|nr:unnamed protein product [Schistosoma curassoni]